MPWGSFAEIRRVMPFPTAWAPSGMPWAPSSLPPPTRAWTRLYPEQFSPEIGEDAIAWLQQYQSALNTQRNRISKELDHLVDSLKEDAGGLEAYLHLKRDHYNDQLSTLVLNRSDLHKVIKKEGALLRKMDPVYMVPLRRNGRAHFFASVKQVGNIFIPTFVFNILVMWILTIALYFLLKFGALRRAIGFFGDLRRKG